MKNNNSKNAKQKPSFKRHDKPNFRLDLARNAAALLLIEVLEKNKTLEDAMLHTPQFCNLTGRDRAFSANVVKSSLRYLGIIDERLSQFLQSPLPDTAFFVRAILRISMGQFFANIAPIHSIIDTAVELAKSQTISFGMKGLVNAVLRRATNAPREEYEILHLLPPVWRARFLSQYGEDKTREIAAATIPNIGVDFTVKSNLTVEEKQEIAKDFDGVWLDNTLRTANLPEGFLQHKNWKNGDIWIQNASATIPAKLLEVKSDEEALDMCAAPGGKTLQLCEMGANVTAIELSAARLKLIKENLARTHFNANLVCGDAVKSCGIDKWDKILLDAPCSATGTLRRNPETLWIKNPTQIPKFIETQAAMVKAAALGLKKNGVLVYAVCSLEEEEGAVAVSTALENGLCLQPIDPQEVYGLHEAINKDGTVRFLPNMLADTGGLDGFFIAKFVKK